MAAKEFKVRNARIWALATVTAAALALGACGKKEQAGAPGAGQPPTVGVVTAQPGVVMLGTELPGRLEANRIAQVRARTNGVVQRVYFAEGSYVKAGDVLFKLEDSSYVATVQSAKASLARAESSLAQASSVVRRYRPLVDANAVSKLEFDNAVNSERAARAEVQAARAALRNAEITLGYTRVTAPISGRTSRANVTEGALVNQAEATLLTTIQQTSPMKVNFTQSVADMMKLRQSFMSGKAGGVTNPEVNVVLEDGSVYQHRARLMFTDVTVDPSTGQVTLRAEVPNEEGLLLPGMYVRVQLEQARVDNGILLPQQAVTRTQQGDTVLVVNPDGTFAPRKVQVGQAQGTNWVILGGLKAGDKVIVDGVMGLRNAKTVKTVAWTPKTPGAPAPAGAAAPAASAAASAASAAAPAPASVAAPASAAASRPASAASAA